MKRYQIVNRPSDGLELRQLDETARHINELWARLTEFGEEFKKSTDTLTQAAGSLAGRVTVLENPPATEEPTDPEPTPPPIPTIVAAAAGGFINATVSTLEPVDSYDCQLQEEAVEDPPTEWQNAKYGTFSFIPPLPNTNYVVWARSRRAYLQSDWATSDVVNSGFLPYLLLDASNDPLTGTLEISLPPQPGQSYLESPALSIRYIHDMTAYDLFKIWDNSGGLGEGPWLSLGIWSGETGWPPSMPVFGYFNVDYGPKDGGVSATLETTDSSGNQTGRISFYDSGKAFVNKDGDSLFQHGVFENSINVTGTGDYSCAVHIAEYSGNAAIEYYYYTTSWLKYAYQNVSGFFIDWTNYDEPGFWIGDTAWRDGLWLQADGFGLSNYSGSEFGSTGEIAWINSGSLLLYSFSEGTPPFVLTGNNTGVLVTGLNSDLLDGYHASAFALDGHNHDHGALSGLADDDHPQYMLRSDLGSGTDNYIPKFLVGATPTFADSIMSQSGTLITTAGSHFLDGAADQTQLTIQANSTQTTDMIVVENSAGQDLLSFTSGNNPRLQIYGYDSGGAVWRKWYFYVNTSGGANIYADKEITLRPGIIGAAYEYVDIDTGGSSNIRIKPEYAGSGESPAGPMISGTGTNLCIFPDIASGAAGHKLVMSCYDGTQHRSVVEYANVAAGSVPSLLLCKNVGRVGINTGTKALTVPFEVLVNDSGTTAVANANILSHNTSGTPAAGFGVGTLYQLESSTTADQDAAKIEVSWTDATHATRKANMILSVYDTAIRTGLTIAATGSGATLTAGGTLTVGADDAGHDVTLYGATAGKKMLWDESADTLQLDGTLDLNGGATLGSADTDAITCTGRLIVRTVNDGDMDATDGTTAEVVFNSADSKFYGCTASGTPATWAALN